MNAEQLGMWKEIVRKCKPDAYTRTDAAQARCDVIMAVNALVELVTPEWANLLTWLVIDIEILREHFVDTFDNDDQRDVKVKTARALAIRIREALALEAGE